MQRKLEAVTLFIAGVVLIIGLELAVNRAMHPVYDRTQSGMAVGHEGGGLGGGSGSAVKNQAMPDSWRQLYDWIKSQLASFPMGGGGGGGF